MPRNSKGLLALGAALFAAVPALAQGPVHTPRVHALTHVRIVTAPGQVIESGTVVLRDGLIEAVGASVTIPADARTWDGGDTLTVYPGLIDPAMALSPPSAGRSGGGGRSAPPAEDPDAAEDLGHPVPGVTPELVLADAMPIAEDDRSGRRAAGITTARALPGRGIFRGQAAVLNLGDGPLGDNLLVRHAGQVAGFTTARNVYPSSLMGVVAVQRQTLSDVRWYADAHARYAAAPKGLERPPFNAAFEALGPVAMGAEPLLTVTDDALALLRAAGIAREFGVIVRYVGSGEEYKRLDEIKATVDELIVPVNFPDAPEVKKDDPALTVGLDELRHWDRAPRNPARLHEAGIVLAFTAEGLKKPVEFRARVARAIEAGLPHDVALAACTTEPARMLGLGDRLGTIAAGRIANLVVVDGELFADSTAVREVWIDGNRYEVEEGGGGQGKKDGKGGNASKDAAAPLTEVRGLAGDPLAWNAAVPGQPEAVLVRGATVWTSGPQGKLENADVLVRRGRIAEVGRGLAAPAGAVVIDGRGRHVTPGLIDAHSHAAVVGDVNEGTNNITAEVRIEDVVNSETVNLYRELAGGLVGANLLHGSANAIGGQSSTIKLRYGMPPEALKVAGARPGIKFALGENPKQSNWGDNDSKRYPKSRSGVEQVIRERFLAARDYARQWETWRKGGKKGIPPRRDLQLETVLEILNGERLVHSHSYRADEILMLTRLAEEFGFRIGTFQHVLEGYKVADEMAAHGAGGSCFSDWWAYKFEVYDAIPYAGAIMWDRGVVVSFNSDSAELARRMNLEAAKAVKYGGVPETEALKFVTLNPAVQLGIGDRTGSLEKGKDADFVIWSGDPLSVYSVCEQTWVDGRKYFDRQEDLAARAALAEEREALLAKAAAAGGARKGKGGSGYHKPDYLDDGNALGVCRCAATDHHAEDCTHLKTATEIGTTARSGEVNR